MKKLFQSKRLIISLLTLLPFASNCQVYDDFLGAGQNIGISVSTSPFTSPDTSQYLVSGTTNLPDLAGASRFLAQATMGSNYEEIEYVSTIGINAWMDEQFALPVSSFMTRYDEIYAETQNILTNDNHSNQYTSFVFYDFIFNEPDFLRQKVAFALSQIFVVSRNGILSGRTDALMTYHDILYQGAFGNYRDLLGQITYSSAMAKYLSHFRNRREDVIGNTLPDENFAREIMQLFSIGLEKLNLDGTPVKDNNGNIVPTYDIEVVAEMAKIFTGLGVQTKSDGSENVYFFESNMEHRDETKMFDDYHSVGAKKIFNGIEIPAGQTGIEDIEQTLDAIFNHDNVGPFIGKRLIQHLVKSNPTPAYVQRVAMVFNNNGKGERGDMKAVVKAVLLDPEARNCDWINHPENGKLIQPIERFTSLFNAFDVSSPSGTLWFNDDDDYGPKLLQSFQKSNTVFNYFSPFYAEDDVIAPQDLVSPEFQILDGISSIEYLNEMEDALKKKPFSNRTAANSSGSYMTTNNDDEPFLDFTDEIDLYNTSGLSALLDRLDLLVCRGQLSQGTKDIIETTIDENIQNLSNYDVNDIMHDVLYYIFLSPDYMIQK